MCPELARYLKEINHVVLKADRFSGRITAEMVGNGGGVSFPGITTNQKLLKKDICCNWW